MASKDKKTKVTMSELQDQIKALHKRVNMIDNDLDTFDKLTLELHTEVESLKGTKDIADLLEKIDVIETIYGEAHEYARGGRGRKKRPSKSPECVDKILRRLLVRKKLIGSGDLTYEYLKPEFRTKE